MRTFLATAHGGELEFMDQEALNQFLIMNTGNMVVQIGKERRQRSNKQNRYAHGVLLQALSDATGFTIEEIKQVLKKEFGLTKVITVNGRDIEVLRSTAELSTSEFEDFMAKSRMLAAREFNIIIPEPNEIISNPQI